jgi:site-specific recombinase XerD
MRYVKEYKDRHGKVRRYLRLRGLPAVALPGVPGSLKFDRAYADALASAAPAPRRKAADRNAADSVTQVLQGFYRSPKYVNMKPSSKRMYRHVLDAFDKKHGHRSVRDMPTHAAQRHIEAIGETRPGMANLTRSVLHKFMAYVVKSKWRTDNPISAIDAYKLGSHHCWTDAELAAYEKRWPLGSRERLAYSLLLFTDQRVSDVCRMRRQDIRDGMIHLVQQKTGKEMAVPIHPALARALEAGPTLGMSLIGDKYGRAIGSRGLSSLVTRAAGEAALPRHCVPHGLRKALQRRLAERGASGHELQAISGHSSLKETDRYTKAANQVLLARSAMARLPDEA